MNILMCQDIYNPLELQDKTDLQEKKKKKTLKYPAQDVCITPIQVATIIKNSS